MNNQSPRIIQARCALAIITLICCALACLCGCRPKAENLLYDFKTQPQMLREIQTLNLTPAEPALQDRPIIDPNRPAPPQLEIRGC